MQACGDTLRSVKIAGPEPPPPSGVMELSPTPTVKIK